MRFLTLVTVCSLFPLMSTACDSGHIRERQETREPAPAALPSAAPAHAAVPAPAKRTEPSAKPTAANEISWPSTVAWYPYTEGLAEAKTSGKPILLLVYADWCSKCRALAPVFERSDVQALLNQLVVVRQNQDEPAPWMSQLEGVQGTYVPRIVFLDKNGTPNTKVTSGHPRYPFFYPAENPESLLTSMKLALRI